MFNVNASAILASARKNVAPTSVDATGELKPLKVWLGKEKTLKDKLVLSERFITLDLFQEAIENPQTFKKRILKGLTASFPLAKSTDALDNRILREGIADSIIGDSEELATYWESIDRTI